MRSKDSRAVWRGTGRKGSNDLARGLLYLLRRSRFRRRLTASVHHGGDLFLWPADLESAAYRVFRLPSDSAEARREATDIPPEEIAHAAQYLLGQHISLPLDDLVRETARLFGYQCTGQRVEPAIRRGIALLLTHQRAREEGDIV